MSSNCWEVHFHDATAATLEEAVEIMAKVQLNRTLKKDEVSDIVAFLKTLTGESPVITYPILPRPAGKTLEWRD